MKLTLKNAALSARALGFTLRRSTFDSGEFVAYRKGTGEASARAYFTADLSDALATVRAMAQDDAANRLALGNPATRAAWAEVAAQDAERAAVAAVSPFDANRLAREAEGRAVAFLSDNRPDLSAGSFRLAAALFSRSVAAFNGRGPRAYQATRAANAAREAEASDERAARRTLDELLQDDADARAKERAARLTLDELDPPAPFADLSDGSPLDLSDLWECSCDLCGDISGEGIAPCSACSDPVPSEPAPARATLSPLALAAIPFAFRPEVRAMRAIDELDSLGLDLCDPWAGAFDSSYGFGPSAREGFAQ